MDGSRLALVTLLALGLAVYAGLREARRDLSSSHSERTQGSETSAPAGEEPTDRPGRPRTVRIELESGPLGRFWPFRSRPLRGGEPFPEIDVPKGEGLW